LSRGAIDQCASILEPLLGLDLRKILFGDPREAAPRLQATALAQPALFCVSFSVAALWRSLGFEAAAMLGHSIGEFVAATLAGVMRLEDALTIVAARGAMMQELPEGAMLAVMLAEPELKTACPAISRSPRSTPIPSALSLGRIQQSMLSRRS
jgi:phthiocerol/phenolphthiocerol synthesis type-I polyketide synthase E